MRPPESLVRCKFDEEDRIPLRFLCSKPQGGLLEVGFACRPEVDGTGLYSRQLDLFSPTREKMWYICFSSPRCINVSVLARTSKPYGDGLSHCLSGLHNLVFKIQCSVSHCDVGPVDVKTMTPTWSHTLSFSLRAPHQK